MLVFWSDRSRVWTNYLLPSQMRWRLQLPVWKSTRTRWLGIQLPKSSLSETSFLWQREPFSILRYLLLLTIQILSLIDCLNPLTSPSTKASQDALRIEAAHVIASLSYGLSAFITQVTQTAYPFSYRFGRGTRYTLESKHTPCYLLCNISFYKNRPSISSCSLLPCFTGPSCLYRWHRRTFVVGFETGQFDSEKWCSTSAAILLSSLTNHFFISSPR